MPLLRKKKKKEFDPEGSGYDEEAGERLAKKYPLTRSKPKEYEGDAVNTDSYHTWVWHPEVKDYKRHGSSLDPESGKVLKGRKHPTYHLTEKEEKRRGSQIFKSKDGRYYSREVRGKGM